MKLLQVIFLIFVCVASSVAQLTQPARFEKEQKAFDNDFTLISLEQHGLALFRETDTYKDGKHDWQLILLDTALRQRLDTTLAVDRSRAFVGHEYAKGALNLLYQEGEFARNKTTLCVIDLQSFILKQYDIKTELDLRLTHFSCIGSSILLGGYISNEPTIVQFNLTESKVHLVPGFLQRNTELLDLRVNENNTFNVVMVEKVSNEGKRIIFRTFDAQAKILLEDIVECDKDRSVLTSISSSLQREDLLLVGTWSSRSSTKALGFYTTLINPFEEQKIALTAFGSLNHYLDFLKPRRVQKIKTKTKNALINHKLYDYTNNVLIYKIMEHTNGFLVLAETYSPVSTTPSNYYGDPNNSQNWNNPYYYNPYASTYPTSRIYRPIGYNENVNNEDEIKTYSSSLLSIDKTGEIVNDYSLKIENRKLPSVTQVTDATLYKKDAFLLYREEKNILYKKILELSDDVEEGKETIRLKDSFDELRSERNNEFGIRHWHGNIFYTWGYQTIRNQTIKEGKIREVFYVNKILVR